jgi:hypothetical protein
MRRHRSAPQRFDNERGNDNGDDRCNDDDQYPGHAHLAVPKSKVRSANYLHMQLTRVNPARQ